MRRANMSMQAERVSDGACQGAPTMTDLREIKAAAENVYRKAYAAGRNAEAARHLTGDAIATMLLEDEDLECLKDSSVNEIIATVERTVRWADFDAQGVAFSR